MSLSIGQLANLTQETVKTLRFWTDEALLQAERGENGYRYYQSNMVERVQFIRSTQAIGFTLGEIKSVLDIRAEGVKPCEEVRQELQTHLNKIQDGIAELKRLEADLITRLAWAEKNPDPDCEDDGCVYLQPEPLQT